MFFEALLLVVVFSSSETHGSPAPGGVIYAAAPEERGAFFVGGKGVYNYGYNTGDGIAKVEVRNQDGSVTGSYRYFDPLGRQIVRSYIADKRGFRVLGNELPVSPDTNVLGVLNAQTLLGPTEGTGKTSSGTHFQASEQAAPLQNKVDLTSSADRSASTTPQEAAAVEKYNQLIMAQEELIRKQQDALNTLKAQKQGFQHQQLGTFQDLKVDPSAQVQRTQDGYFASAVDSLGSTSPYFYSEDNINYDFPAGFAYNSPGIHYTVVYPVGVKGHESPSLLSAGHTPNSKRIHTLAGPTREYRPVYNYGNYVNRRIQTPTYKRPFIIGHNK